MKFCIHVFSVLHAILAKINGGNTLHPDTLNYLAEANQLGLSSSDLTVCSLSTFPCQKTNLQPRTLCGLVKPMCPVLIFSCRLCKFYLSTKSCRKTCRTSEKFCGSSGCSNSSTPSEPVTYRKKKNNQLLLHINSISPISHILMI